MSDSKDHREEDQAISNKLKQEAKDRVADAAIVYFHALKTSMDHPDQMKQAFDVFKEAVEEYETWSI